MSQTKKQPGNGAKPAAGTPILNPITKQPVSNPALDKAGKALRELYIPRGTALAAYDALAAFDCMTDPFLFPDPGNGQLERQRPQTGPERAGRFA